tara:strand:- start:518 stop:706 length:189 start_codon:yes stop_codon:yes gene_type:complete
VGIMKCVDKGKNHRIFRDWLLGIFPYYILEDSRNAVFKGGTWLEVKITNHYFKTLNQVKKLI